MKNAADFANLEMEIELNDIKAIDLDSRPFQQLGLSYQLILRHFNLKFFINKQAFTNSIHCYEKYFENKPEYLKNLTILKFEHNVDYSEKVCKYFFTKGLFAKAVKRWCPRPDSNGHSFRNRILSPARLPIPPLGHSPD